MPLVITTPYSVAGCPAWDLGNPPGFVQSFDVNAQETSPTGVRFKTDGTKMFVIGQISDSVHEYTLSSAWSLSPAPSFVQSFSILAQDGSATDVAFRPDGTKMFVTGPSSASVHEYTLSSAWSLSPAPSFVQSFSVVSQDNSPRGLAFKPDGTKMFMVGATGDNVHEYTLPVPWTIAGSPGPSFVQSFSVAGQDTFPGSVSFKDDGTKMFIVGFSSASVHEYTLSSAWSLSPAPVFVQSFSVSGQEAIPLGLDFKTDGLKFFVTGFASTDVHEYNVCP